MTLKTQDMLLISMFTSLMAVGAFIRIETPLVPITLQFAFCAYAGVILGAKKALASQVLYILIGLMGFPVFTRGGGPFYILEPTFGYLIGFIVAAYVIGKITEKMTAFDTKKAIVKLSIAIGVGLFVVYTAGMFYLMFILNTVMETPMNLYGAFAAGVLPFIAADLIVGAVVVVSAMKIIPVLKSFQWTKRY